MWHDVKKYSIQEVKGKAIIMIIEKLHTCCFFGHRKTDVTDELINRLNKIVEVLIKEGKVDTFLFGSKSEFNDLCYMVVTELKQKYPHIKRIYVRAEFRFIDEGYRSYLLKQYEETYYPEKIINAGNAAYVERNREMIDKSSFCVVYYDENYAPPRRRNSRRNLTGYQPKSGTKLAYDYAKRKGVRIFNALN